MGSITLCHAKIPTLPAMLATPPALLHQCLGHPSTAPLHFLSKTIPEIMFDFKHVCEVCSLAKQTGLSFTYSLIQSTASFNLIYCHIWGLTRFQHILGHVILSPL